NRNHICQSECSGHYVGNDLYSNASENDSSPELDKNAPVKLLRDVSHKVREEKMIENEAGSQGKEEYLYDCLQNN
ncbi:12845_t:CDS:2, partial [Entrophospora sp. SA101]